MVISFECCTQILRIARFMITVFTPAYNRAKYLPKVYESLCKQTFKDFEWVVVDDGSTDGTAELFHLNENVNDNENLSIFPSFNSFKVRYYYQENGGKHRAINRGVQEAKGELFLILDSDDTLPPRSLELIDHYYQQIKDDASFGGVCGYMAHHDGTIIGHGNDDKVLDANSIEMQYCYHIQGDMCEVFRTAVLKEIPFPDIPGERFVPEDLVLHRIAEKYKLRIFHEVIYYRDYLEGGLTDKIIKIRMDSPVSSVACYGELNKRNIPFIFRTKAAINYYRFYFCLPKSKGQIKYEKISKVWLWAKPLGWLMHINDLRITR